MKKTTIMFALMLGVACTVSAQKTGKKNCGSQPNMVFHASLLKRRLSKTSSPRLIHWEMYIVTIVHASVKMAVYYLVPTTDYW